MRETRIDIDLHGSLAEIPAEDWDACACPEAADSGRPDDPFTTHRFIPCHACCLNMRCLL